MTEEEAVVLRVVMCSGDFPAIAGFPTCSMCQCRSAGVARIKLHVCRVYSAVTDELRSPGRQLGIPLLTGKPLRLWLAIQWKLQYFVQYRLAIGIPQCRLVVALPAAYYKCVHTGTSGGQRVRSTPVHNVQQTKSTSAIPNGR
ncbi:hypothetical protein LSAT2_019345 [Lamellibrachia satsuma]|nr:hypothetical protein LSAT2_019345 [Lamellibrachia satsuma]